MTEHSLENLSDERRVLARKMIDLIAEDETFRTLILDDPVAAMEHGGLVDGHDRLVDEFYEVKVDEDAEVSGFTSFSLGIQRLDTSSTSISSGDRLGSSPTWVMAPSCSFPTTGKNCG